MSPIVLTLIKEFAALHKKMIAAEALGKVIEKLHVQAKKGALKRMKHVGLLRDIQDHAVGVYNLLLEANSKQVQFEFTKDLYSKINQALKEQNKPKNLGKIVDLKTKNEEREKNTSHNNKRVISAKELNEMVFEVLDFEGRWMELIGKPSIGFFAMVYANAKMGKSYLNFQFANYMLNFGAVLYCLAEEGFGYTAQKKMRECGIDPYDTKLDFSESKTLEDLAKDLKNKDYKTLFIDSVSELELTPEEFKAFRHSIKPVNIIGIFHVTKDGNFKGPQGWKHDVDIVINLPEKGIAVQNGRFGSGNFDVFQEVVTIEE